VCEQHFSKNGESYVLRECARQNGAFKLRELLLSGSSHWEKSEDRLYEVSSLLGAKAEQYLYFAASIFWRAGARSWSIRDVRVNQIKLGKYQDQLRLYLNGKAGFPENGRLLLIVASETIPLRSLIPPWTARSKGAHCHTFYIPGILFTLFLSGKLPSECECITLNSSKGKFMLLAPVKETSFVREVIATTRCLTQKG
jgi:hypothetical protein